MVTLTLSARASKQLSKALHGFVTLLSSAAVVVSSVGVSMADTIIVDPSAPGTGFLHSSNGTPVINIAPTQDRVSHNIFDSFHVGDTGVILNNSGANKVSQIGQYVAGNPNTLVAGPADIILNEVTGTGPTSLTGTTEVVGRQARVIVANPNGVMCNGCAFLNTRTSVLTTGKPTVVGGNPGVDLTVTQGTVTIGPDGFHPGRSGALIGRHVLLDGPIATDAQGDQNRMLLSGGAQFVDGAGRNHLDRTNIVAAPHLVAKTSPFAIDASQRATLTAGDIFVRNPETGLGVNLYGDIQGRTLAASSGGDLFYRDVKVDQSVHLSGAEVRQYGDVTAGEDVLINGRAFTLYDGRVIEAGSDIEIGASDYVVIAGEVSGGSIDVSVTDGSLTNTGFLLADGALTLVAGDSFAQQRQIATEYDTQIDPAIQQYIAAYYAQLAQGGAEADLAAEMIARAGEHDLVAQYIEKGATSTGSRVVVIAEEGDVLNEGGAIAATKSVNLDAGNDVVNQAMVLEHAVEECNWNLRACSDKQSFHAAEVLSGGTAAVEAGNDIFVTGSNIAAADSLTLVAERDVRARPSSVEITTTNSEHFWFPGGVSVTNTVSLNPSQLASLTDDVVIEAGGDIEINGALVSAQNSIKAEAGESISVETASSGVYHANYINASCFTDPNLPCEPYGGIGEYGMTAVSPSLVARNIWLSGEDDISFSGARIYAEDELSVHSESGSVSVGTSYVNNDLSHHYDKRPEFFQLTPNLVGGLFDAEQSEEAAAIGSEYLTFLRENEVLTAVEALRRAESGADLKEAARSVGAEDFVSLLDDPEFIAATSISAQTDEIWSTKGAALNDNYSALADLHFDFAEDLDAWVKNAIDVESVASIEIAEAEAAYDAAIAKAQAAHERRVAKHREKRQIIFIDGCRPNLSKNCLRYTGPGRSWVGIQKIQSLRRVTAKSAARRSIAYFAARVALNLAKIDHARTLAPEHLHAELDSLTAAFEAADQTLRNERAVLNDDLNLTLDRALRSHEAMMQTQVDAAAAEGLAVARGSVVEGEASLAAALTKQALPELAQVAPDATTVPALSDEAEQQADFVDATAWRFASRALSSSEIGGVRGPYKNWSRLVAQGDSLALNSGRNLDLNKAYISSEGQVTLTAGGTMAVVDTDLLSNSLGGTMNLAAGGDVLGRGSRLNSAGGMSISSGLGSVDLGATSHEYTQVPTFHTFHFNVVGTLADGQFDKYHDLISQDLSTLDVGGDLNIHAGTGEFMVDLPVDLLASMTTGDLVLGGVQASVGENVSLTANRNMGFIAPRSEIVYSRGSSRSGSDKLDIQPHVTDFLVGGDFAASAGNNMLLEGTSVEAGGAVALNATNDLMLSAAQEVYKYSSRTYSKNWFRTKRAYRQINRVTHEGTDLAAAGQMDLESEKGDLITAGSSLVSAEGDINISATEGDILAGAFQDVSSDQRRTSRSFLFGLISSNSSSFKEYETNTGTSLLAGLDLNVVSGGDTELVGAELSAGRNMNLNVGGDLHVRAAIDAAREENFEQNNGLILTTTATEKSNRETAVLTTLNAAGDMTFSIGGTPHITLYHTEDQPSQSVAELYPEELQALAGLVLLDEELLDKYFYEETKALSPAFTMVLTIALTQGFGNLLSSKSIAGLNVGKTVTLADGATKTVYTLTHAGNAAAAMAASTTVGIANGTISGDLDLGEILRSAMISAGTSYLTSSLNLKAMGDPDAAASAANSAETVLASAEEMGTKFLTPGHWDMSLQNSIFGSNLSLANVFEGAFDATITAGVQTAANGGDFKDAFRNSFIGSVVSLGLADAQKGIGDLELGEGSFGHMMLHGLAGCTAAELQGASCAAGAAGGIAQSLYAGTLDDLGPEERAAAVSEAEMYGAVAGWLFSGGQAENVSVGSSVAVSGFVNNYLNHDQMNEAQELLEEYRQSCWGEAADVGGACSQIQLRLTELEDLSAKNTGALLSACGADPTSAACRDHINVAADYVEWADNVAKTDRFDVGLGLFYHPGLEGRVGYSLDAAILGAYEDSSESSQAFLAATEQRILDTVSWFSGAKLTAAADQLEILAGPEVPLDSLQCPAEGHCFATNHELARGELATIGIVDVLLPDTWSGVAAELALLATGTKLVQVGGKWVMRVGDDFVEVIAPNRTGDLFDNPSQVVGSRIDELTAQIPENSRGRITMGVAVVEDAAGNRQILVSTSEPNGYLRPGVSLNDGEVLVRGPRGSHAEADIVRYAEENGLTVVDIGATRPVCANCQSIIPDDTNITTPLK